MKMTTFCWRVILIACVNYSFSVNARTTVEEVYMFSCYTGRLVATRLLLETLPNAKDDLWY